MARLHLASLATAVVMVVTAQGYSAASEVTATAIGHEYRQDDWPSLATAPDGSVWAAWLSYGGERDDVALRQFQNNRWGPLQWVPNTSGDSWLPQVVVDGSNRVWVVWSQQVNGNWDLYARWFDPARQEWGEFERLTFHALPDINPRVSPDGRGGFGVVWQGFRDRNSNIFLKRFDGKKWSGEIRVTTRAANDWEPAVAFDGQGTAWIAYDSYKSGNYNVFLSAVRDERVAGEELTVSATPNFEARATVAVDNSGRVWVAWEEGLPNWGKDTGYVIRDRLSGTPLGGFRLPRIRCYERGQWKEPQADLALALAQEDSIPLTGANLSPLAPALIARFNRGNAFHPHVFSDGRGSVWVAAKALRVRLLKPNEKASTTYWEYWLTHLEGNQWSKPLALPNSKGRSATRISTAVASDGTVWLAWPTDNRSERLYQRPIREQVYAAAVPAPNGNEPAPALKSIVEKQVQVTPAHSNETGDIRAMRAYLAVVGGRKLRLLRGDFHRHTEFSWDDGGKTDGSLQDFYRYMLDAAGLDFGASTDHQGGLWPYWWWYTQKLTDMYHVPGAYVPIFGYERSAHFPFGHRNVFFAKRSESRVTPFFVQKGGAGLPPGPVGDEPTWTGTLVGNDTRLLYEEVRGRNGIVVPHTSGSMQGTDWKDNDPGLEPVVEIFQGARLSFEAPGAPHTTLLSPEHEPRVLGTAKPEGLVSNAWTKGYRLGVLASSDHHSTHISYAMVYTDDPSRQGILDALRKRHSYGAMDNIILDVRMGNSFMGDEFALTRPLPLRIKLRGTRPVARVTVIKDNKVVYSTEPNRQEVELEFTDRGDVSSRHFYYVRAEQDDGMLAWSSPMFVNYR